MKRTALQTVSAALALAATSGTAAAHVDYVTEPGDPGSAADLFAAILSSPTSLALLAGGALATVAACAGYIRFGRSLLDVQVARETLQSYRPYLPWMLRLAVGLPLVGAGFAGYLFSPSVPADARIIQVGIGFLLLFGLGTRLVAVAGLGAYLVALVTVGTPMLLASEYVAGFLAIALVGPGQPSADMMIRRMVRTDGTIASQFRGFVTPQELLARAGIGQGAVPVALRLFLGLNFLYLGVVQKWLQPAEALAVVAKYDLTSVVPVSPELWVFGAGLVEAGVGLAFVVGLFTRGTATVAFVMLTTTLFGLPDDPVLAHITLFGLTSALMVTGAGRYSLDSTVIPTLRQRVDPGSEPPAPTGAD